MNILLDRLGRQPLHDHRLHDRTRMWPHVLAFAVLLASILVYQSPLAWSLIPHSWRRHKDRTDLQRVDGRTLLEQAQHVLQDSAQSAISHQYAVEMLKEAAPMDPSVKRLLLDVYFAGSWKLRPDYHKALALSRELADAGDAHGLYMLGVLYAEGLVVPKDFIRALAYFSFAAKDGSRAAQLACSYVHGNGIGVKADASLARRYLLLAAEDAVRDIRERNLRPMRHSIVFSLDGILSSSSSSGKNSISQRNLLEFYQFSASHSSPTTLMLLGQIYYFGNADIDVDYGKARKYFEMALERGHNGAYGFLGQMYLRGEGVAVDVARAFRYFREGLGADHLGGGLAYNGLGLCYQHGYEVQQDGSEALEYFLKAIQRGSVEAMYNAAVVMLEEDPAAYHDIAIDLLMNASKSGYLLANYELAKLHSRSDRLHNLCVYLLRTFFDRYCFDDAMQQASEYGTRGLPEQALSRLVLLAYQGHDEAQVALADLYYAHHSDPVKGSHDKNHANLDRNHAKDKDHHKKKDEHGNAVKRKAIWGKRAATWYYRAAQQGDSKSRNRLGDVFFYGVGLPRPIPAAAMANYLISLHNGDAEGAYNVGYLYEHGIGVPQCFHFARSYYSEALHLARQRLKLPGDAAYWAVRLALLRVALRERQRLLLTGLLIVAVALGLSACTLVAFHVVKHATMDLRQLASTPRLASRGPYRQDTPLPPQNPGPIGDGGDFEDSDVGNEEAIRPLLEEQ